MFTPDEINAIAEQAAKDICKRYPSTARACKRIPALDEQWQYECYYDIEPTNIRDGLFTRPSVKWKYEL